MLGDYLECMCHSFSLSCLERKTNEGINLFRFLPSWNQNKLKEKYQKFGNWHRQVSCALLVCNSRTAVRCHSQNMSLTVISVNIFEGKMLSYDIQKKSCKWIVSGPKLLPAVTRCHRVLTFSWRQLGNNVSKPFFYQIVNIIVGQVSIYSVSGSV